MSDGFYDPIVAEVRRNREELLADFGGDIDKLNEYLESKQPEREAAGVRYVTEEERQARLAWRRQQQEEMDRQLAAL